MIKVSLEKLLEVGAHLGHQSRHWNPKMTDYLYGTEDGVHVFDLAKTRKALLEALDVLQKAASKGKTILFVGTKKQAKEKVKEVAEKTGNPYVSERWLGGTFTNFEQILKSIRKLDEMKTKMKEGEYDSFTKKEKLLISREIDRLERLLGGIAKISQLPDLVVVIDVKREIGAVREANKFGIETIGVVDSNSDPTIVTWPIPMNDDSSQALGFVLGLFEKVVLQGKKARKK